jgi:hypothetical protein
LCQSSKQAGKQLLAAATNACWGNELRNLAARFRQRFENGLLQKCAARLLIALADLRQSMWCFRNHTWRSRDQFGSHFGCGSGGVCRLF